MPEKIGHVDKKTPEQKKLDEKLLKEIEAETIPEEFDPLASQAAALPDSIKGSESGKDHVQDIDGDSGSESFNPSEADEEFDDQDDPSKLTAD